MGLRQTDRGCAVSSVDQWWTQLMLLYYLQYVLKACELHAYVCLIMGVGHCKVRIEAFQGDTRQGSDVSHKRQDFIDLLGAYTQAPHTRIYFHMHFDCLSQGQSRA